MQTFTTNCYKALTLELSSIPTMINKHLNILKIWLRGVLLVLCYTSLL